MARITRFRAHPVQLPLLRPFTTAVRSADTLETVLVEVEDDSGRSGWGEAPISRVTGISTAEAVQVIQDILGPLVVGTETDSLAQVLQLLAASGTPAAARMAVDCALHDLAAAAAGLALAEFLAREYPGLTGRPNNVRAGGFRPHASGSGGTGAGPSVGQGRLRTDMTLSVAGAASLAATARGYAADGFQCLKVKLNADGDPVERLLAVREAVGPSVVLRVDANQAFSPAAAIAAIRGMQTAGVGLELVEQPVPAGNWAGLAEVRAHVDTPVMADESVWTLEDLDSLLATGAADLVNVKLAKAGGLYPAVQLVCRAREAGVGVLVGCMLESTVGIGAAGALAVAAGLDRAFPGRSGQDLDGGLWLRSPAVDGGPSYAGSEIVLSGLPGLGIRGLAASGAVRT